MDWLVWFWDMTFLCPPIADIMFLKSQIRHHFTYVSHTSLFFLTLPLYHTTIINENTIFNENTKKKAAFKIPKFNCTWLKANYLLGNSGTINNPFITWFWFSALTCWVKAAAEVSVGYRGGSYWWGWSYCPWTGALTQPLSGVGQRSSQPSWHWSLVLYYLLTWNLQNIKHWSRPSIHRNTITDCIERFITITCIFISVTIKFTN